MSALAPLSANQRLSLKILVALYATFVLGCFFGIFLAAPSALTFGGFLGASAGGGLVACALGACIVKL